MIRQVRIQNYKSILDDTIELGRINVFIGENGCGKTNILEAVAMASASIAGKLDSEELYSRGVRIAKPSVTFSSFLGTKQKHQIDISFTFEGVLARGARSSSKNIDNHRVDCRIRSEDANDIGAKWFDTATDPILSYRYWEKLRTRTGRALAAKIINELFHDLPGYSQEISLSEYVIYNLNAPALRGIQPISRREPLGINGENLDVLIASMDASTVKELLTRARLVSWLDTFFVDHEDTLKFQGHKLGRSVSALYFRDRFMGKRNNIFSAENANEGILHILFYLALFLSEKTPKVFGIDNIETALNPRLCRKLVTDMAALAKKHDKQALVTTHNPAALDGLNLHDDEQRLFVVYRDGGGHTVTKRIKMKPNVGAEKMPLSELWMRGHLGGIPKEF